MMIYEPPLTRTLFMLIKTTAHVEPSKPANAPELPFMIPTPDEDGTKVVDGKYHTLFVSDEDPVMKEFTAVDDGEEYAALREIVPKHKKYTLFIQEFGHDDNELHKILFELRKATEHDVLELRINSNGGYVTEGIVIYNAMRELFNGRTVTFNDAAGYSMGAMIFSLGDERVTYEDSSLMYHTFSTGYFGKGSEIKSYIEYEDKHFEDFFRKKIVTKGYITEDEYQQMKIGKDFWLDSFEMATRGISTHVIVSGFKLDNEAFIEYHGQDLPIEEWVMGKLLEMAEEETGEETPVKKKPSKKKPTSKDVEKKKPVKKKKKTSK